MKKRKRKLTLWHYRREVAELQDLLENAWAKLEDLYQRYPNERPQHISHPREYRRYWLQGRY